jgi:hypothetical protein
MATYAPQAHRLHRPHVNPWLLASVVFAAAFVGLGAWVIVDRTTGGGGATQDARTLIDNFFTASSANDGNAAAALFTKNGVLWQSGDVQATGTKAIASLITNQGGLSVERIAPVTVNGDYATTFMNFSVLGLAKTPMVSVFQIKDGKIARMWGFVLGLDAPFDNAAR